MRTSFSSLKTNNAMLTTNNAFQLFGIIGTNLATHSVFLSSLSDDNYLYSILNGII